MVWPKVGWLPSNTVNVLLLPCSCVFPQPIEGRESAKRSQATAKTAVGDQGGGWTAMFVVTEYLYFRGHHHILLRRKQEELGKKAERMSGDRDRKNVLGNDGSNKNYHSCVDELVQ